MNISLYNTDSKVKYADATYQQKKGQVPTFLFLAGSVRSDDRSPVSGSVNRPPLIVWRGRRGPAQFVNTALALAALGAPTGATDVHCRIGIQRPNRCSCSAVPNTGDAVPSGYIDR